MGRRLGGRRHGELLRRLFHRGVPVARATGGSAHGGAAAVLRLRFTCDRLLGRDPSSRPHFPFPFAQIVGSRRSPSGLGSDHSTISQLMHSRSTPGSRSSRSPAERHGVIGCGFEFIRTLSRSPRRRISLIQAFSPSRSSRMTSSSSSWSLRQNRDYTPYRCALHSRSSCPVKAHMGKHIKAITADVERCRWTATARTT